MNDSPTIESVEAAAYTIPTEVKEADGTMEWDHTTLVVVKAHAGGRAGTGWTYSDPAAVQVATGVLAEAVTGLDALDVEAANEAMQRQLRNVGAVGIGAAALSAVDVALWDLAGRWWGIPVSRLLGRVDRELPIYGSGGFTTYDDAQTAKQLSGWVDEWGVRAVKIKIGESWGTRETRDLERVAVARDAIGDEGQLMVDANGAYGVAQAKRMERAMRQFDVVWFEEPVSGRDLAGLAAVRHASVADVAAGEYGWNASDFRDLITAGAVDTLQADVTRCGGFTAWRKVAALAAAHEIPISSHTAPSLSAQVAGVATSLRHLEWFHDHARIEERYVDGALQPREGTVRPSPDPGHGMAIKEADLSQWAVR